MTYTLRNYQTESVDAGVNFLLDGGDKNGLVVAPTGCGKSLIIANIVQRLKAPCIIFQPTKEILTQNFAKFVSYGYKPAVFSAALGERRVGDITLATIGSVYKQPELFQHVKYVIIDECHSCNAKDDNTMYMQFINALNGVREIKKIAESAGIKWNRPDGIGGVRVLGLTASPYRLVTDGYGGSILKFLTRTRPRVFHKVVHVVQNGDLFRAGYLAKIDYKVVKTGFNRGRLRLNSTGADYTDESVRNHFKELNFSDQIVRCVNRLFELKRGNSIVFTRFVEEAEYVASKIPGAAVITAKSGSRERDNIISAFKAGRIPCVCNVGVLGIGFDYPELKNVILARPTMSLAVFYQQVGRCVRTHPSKDCAFVVDMVGLSEQFGKVEDLTVVEGDHEKWFIESNGKQLTNVYYGERHGRPQW